VRRFDFDEWGILASPRDVSAAALLKENHNHENFEHFSFSAKWPENFGISGKRRYF
jgi:hypothetical protein